MDLLARLLVALFVITAPTVLYLGLLRGLEKLRDDALLLRLAESDEAPQDVSTAAARALDRPPIRAEGQSRNDNAVACSSCGESNMMGARYCQGCLGELH
jgi:hypothetical protein